MTNSRVQAFKRGSIGIACTTPLRISYIGGGTDYREFFHEFGGHTIGASIDWHVRTVVMALPSFAKEKFRVTYRLTESVQQTSDIKHPSVRAILENFGLDLPMNIATMCSAPSESGLGSSSSFAVSLLHIMSYLKSEETINPLLLAKQAIDIERKVLSEKGGFQDQVYPAFGGINSIKFGPDEQIEVDRLEIPKEIVNDFSDCHLLINFGASSHSEEIAKRVSDGINNEVNSKELIDVLSLTKDVSSTLKSRLENRTLTSDNLLKTIGEALTSYWNLKKRFSNLTKSELPEEIFANLKRSSISAFKTLGAGNRGFVLALAEQDKIAHFLENNQTYYTYRPKITFDASTVREI